MRFRKWIMLFAAGCLSAATLFVTAWMKNPYGRCSAEGVRAGSEYYLYSPSSQAKIVQSVGLDESFFLTGEKSVFLFSSENEAGRYVSSLLEEQNADVVFEEEWEDVRSVYAYVRQRGNGIRLPWGKVNLHIVWKGACVQVGTPIIFGGY